MTKIIILLLVFLFAYLAKKEYLKWLKKESLKQINNLSNYLDEYEMNLLESFDIYKKEQTFYDYNINKKEKILIKDSCFLDADIKSAFSKITALIIKDQNHEINWRGEPNLKEIKKIKKILNNGTEMQKLLFVNKKIEQRAIDVAVENSFSKDNKLNLIGNGAKYIALRAFNIETYLGFHYPESNHKLLYKLLKKRQNNSELSPDEFWEYVN